MLELKLATQQDSVTISRMSAALIEQGLPQTWSARRVRHHIRRKDSVVLIARDAEQVMGFAVMEFGEHSAHLDLLAVSTLARRQGLARRMVEWLHDTAITAGIFSIHLELRVSNGVALKFYTAMGYRQTDFKSRYYWATEGAICMKRYLAVSPQSPSVFSLPSKYLVREIG